MNRSVLMDWQGVPLAIMQAAGGTIIEKKNLKIYLHTKKRGKLFTGYFNGRVLPCNKILILYVAHTPTILWIGHSNTKFDKQ